MNIKKSAYQPNCLFIFTKNISNTTNGVYVTNWMCVNWCTCKYFLVTLTPKNLKGSINNRMYVHWCTWHYRLANELLKHLEKNLYYLSMTYELNYYSPCPSKKNIKYLYCNVVVSAFSSGVMTSCVQCQMSKETKSLRKGINVLL